MKKTTPQWIQHLDDLPATLRDAQRWYLDTEFIRERTYYAELALVQVAAAGHVVLIDAPALTAPDSLGQLIAGKTLVLHACSEDIDVLTHATGRAPTHIEDTQLAAALLDTRMQPSYQSLVEDICQVTLAKEATRSNWLQRPLTPKQLNYAADDVNYLDSIHDAQTQRLHQLGRYDWWQEECRRLLNSCTRSTQEAKLWRHVKGAGLLDAPARARLQQLAIWRDRQARERNLPRSFVIRDHDLIVICRQTPTNLSQLAQCSELSAKQIRRDGDALLDLLQQSANHPAPPALPDRLSGQQAACYKRWKKLTTRKAQELQIDAAFLARRRWLEALVRQPDKVPEPLRGWRYEVITKQLLEAS